MQETLGQSSLLDDGSDTVCETSVVANVNRGEMAFPGATLSRALVVDSKQEINKR